MPISSLSKFTVPLSTDQSASSQGLLMPKLKYRFRVTLDGFGVAGTPATELTKQVMTVDRPNVTFEEVKLNVYNSTVKLAGKHSFADAKLTLRDDVTGAVSKKVGEQLQKQFDFFEQSGAASGIDYKFLTKLEMLDGGNGANEPVVLESWELYGCYIVSADYGPMNYGTNEAVAITMNISYDNANQGNQGGGGIGAVIGRTVNDVVTGIGTGP